jgi:hypothetical protein
MELKNDGDVLRVRGQYFAMLFIFVTLIVVSFIGRIFEVYLLPFPKQYYAAFFGFIWITLLVIRNHLTYNFIYFSDAGKIIMLRYFHVRYFNNSYKSIEIPKNTLYKYELKTSFFKLKQELVLFQKTAKGIAKYPPVSLSSLKKNEIRKIIESLDLYTISKN